MNRIQLALFPAILLGILAIVFVASLANTSETVQASTSLFDSTQAAAALAPTAADTWQPAIATGPQPDADSAPQPTATSAPQPAAASPQPAPAAQSGDCPLSSRYPASVRQWCTLIVKYAV